MALPNALPLTQNKLHDHVGSAMRCTYYYCCAHYYDVKVLLMWLIKHRGKVVVVVHFVGQIKHSEDIVVADTKQRNSHFPFLL